VAGEPLRTKLVGAEVEAHGFHGYWVYPYFASDSNLTCTLLLEVLGVIAEKRKDAGKTALPSVLLLQMDNCGRENKNHTVLACLGAMVHLQWFQEVYLTFLPVGHTHAKVDQRFSRISLRLKGKDCATLQDMELELAGDAPR
jgi:hypothetical protein